MVKFYLDKDQISSLREKTKLQNYLSSLLSGRMYVKASMSEMVLYVASAVHSAIAVMAVSKDIRFVPCRW